MSDINSTKSPQKLPIPNKLRELLRAEYGEEAERVEAGYSAERSVTLRANTLKTTAEKVAEALEAAQFSFARPSWYPDAFVLEGARERDLTALPLYERGEIYLQSLSSMLPPLVLRPKEGESVLDATAAPGGKTTQLCALSGGRALVTACERDKIRFDRLRFNLARQGAARVNAMLTDACKLDDFFRFDKILLDAPCSASGTISPDSLRWSEKLLDGCQRTQAALLKKALRLLKRGGTLVYSTCSVLKEENEAQLDRALPGSGCRLVPIEAPFLAELPLLPGREGTVTVCPDGKFEGFFLAEIVKD